MSHDFLIRFLPAIHADGPTQMGMDLALLDHAESEPTAIWLRVYTWSAPTLSLGYFQAWNELPEMLRSAWAGQAMVRRPTGGGAIWHDGDLTYAVVVPAAHPWAGHSRTLYQAIHNALASLLQQGGAAVARRSEVQPSHRPGLTPGVKSSPFLCFDDGDADDLLLKGHKIVGGAQRRRGWATLQHGSVHWQRSALPQAAHLPGLVDMAPAFHEPSAIKWGLSLGPRLGALWQMPVEPTAFPPEVMLTAHGWSNRLRQPEWLLKR
ncbi:MAG: lipoyl protein ligase domain-containing protein [Isosphaeraceae bacterium]